MFCHVTRVPKSCKLNIFSFYLRDTGRVFFGIPKYAQDIMLIDKTDSSDPTRRTFFWMYELKTFAPLGLNICEIV